MTTPNPMPPDLQATLERAVKDLLFSSETDAPLVPVFWPQPPADLTSEALLTWQKKTAETPVETVDFDEYFAALAPDPSALTDGSLDPEQIRNLTGLQSLAQTLKANLTDLTVFRVGHINLDIFMLGRTATHDIAGVQTQAVET